MVFTTEDRQAGEFLLEYVGETLDYEEGVRREKMSRHGRCYVFFFECRGIKYW